MENPGKKIDAGQGVSGPAGSSPRILVVDDESMLREVLVKVLRRLGYATVDAARDGHEAWLALHEMSYSLVITDHKMPKITGLELIERMRSEHMLQPVILLTGIIPTEELDRHPELRVGAVLSKPVAFAELIATVGKLMPATQISQAERASQDQTNSPPRILVVDDNRDSRESMIELLTSCGYVVEGACDGRAGCEALQARHYDLVITDNQMPTMSGLEMIAKLNASRVSVPVIMATGKLPVEAFARQPALKPQAMLEKPFATSDLLDTIRRVLDTDDEGTVLPESF